MQAYATAASGRLAKGAGLLTRGDTPPAAVIRLARRARLYYGLETEAARHLGVGSRYISSVLNLQKFNPSGRLGHSRVFECVAGLVRDCEAAAAAVYANFGISRGRYMRGSTPILRKTLELGSEAAVLVSRLGSGAVRYRCWGEGSTLVRLLEPFSERFNVAAAPPLIHMPDLAEDCRCVGHLLIIRARGGLYLIWDTDAGLLCLEALREVVSDHEFCGYLTGSAAPIQEFNFDLPCAA